MNGRDDSGEGHRYGIRGPTSKPKRNFKEKLRSGVAQVDDEISSIKKKRKKSITSAGYVARILAVLICGGIVWFMVKAYNHEQAKLDKSLERGDQLREERRKQMEAETQRIIEKGRRIGEGRE